jgi:hypothetical protein
MDQDKMSNFFRGPSIDASCQDSVHLVKRFQRGRFFRNQQIESKNFLWWPRLLMDQDETSNRYSGSSIDASFHDSVHLAKRFRGEDFLEIDQSQTRIACGGHICQSIQTK